MINMPENQTKPNQTKQTIYGNKVFLSNTNNLCMFIRFQVFLSNTNNYVVSRNYSYLKIFICLNLVIW